MESKNFLFALIAAATALNSCSGVPGSTRPSWIAGVQGGGNTELALTLRAIPIAPPPATNILSFSLTITGISFLASTGESVNVPLNSSVYQADLTRLQSDSAFFGVGARRDYRRYCKRGRVN